MANMNLHKFGIYIFKKQKKNNGTTGNAMFYRKDYTTNQNHYKKIKKWY